MSGKATAGRMGSRLSLCLTLYRRLASAYPHEFRMLYGEDLDRLGEDAIPDIWRTYGLAGLVRLLADIAIRLPATYLLEIRQDVRYALRLLAKSPGFTSVAVVSLAVGIGMCGAVFSQVQSMLGPAPGIRDPAAVVTSGPVSYPYFEQYRDRHPSIAGATAVMNLVPFAVAFNGDRGRAERFYGHLVSPEYFSTLGVTPAAGRFFSPATERPGAAPVVVVSDRFWREQLTANPHAVGRALRINGAIATIVGVGPKGFLGIWPANPADLFVPATCAASLAPELAGDVLHRADRAIFRAVFRIAPGATLPRAEAGLDAVTRDLDRQYGLDQDHERQGRVLRLEPAGTVMLIWPAQRRAMNAFSVSLWALVLALLCANMANLLLARAGQRSREIAVRLSVGASRARLVRQFLTESVILSVAGGLGGILLAWWVTNVLSSLPLPGAQFEFNCRPDARVLAITLALAMAAGVGFGLAPAFSGARADIGLTLKEGAQAPPRRHRRLGLRNLFVVCQMAASLMLLLVTWYVATGYLRTSGHDFGFQPANLSLLSTDAVRDGYSARDAADLMIGLPDELARIPAVRAASFTTGNIPLASLGVDRPNTRVSVGEAQYPVYRDRVGPHYFAAFGVPLLAGREFDTRDQQADGAALPAILNQAAARQLFGAVNPIGRRIREGQADYTVVGLTRDTGSGYLSPQPAPSLFLPVTARWLRENPAQTSILLIRGAPGSDALAAVRSQLESLHPGLTVFDARTMQEDVDRLNSWIEWDAAIYEILAAFALLLACLGLGGVTAYAVARRRKEIGIRMALGARGTQVRWLVLREGLALLAVGSTIGFAGVWMLLRAMAAFSETLARAFHQQAANPLLMVAAPLALSALATLACYLPARHATSIDPMTALREE